MEKQKRLLMASAPPAAKFWLQSLPMLSGFLLLIATSSDALVASSFSLLVVMPLLLVAMPLLLVASCYW